MLKIMQRGKTLYNSGEITDHFEEAEESDSIRGGLGVAPSAKGNERGHHPKKEIKKLKIRKKASRFLVMRQKKVGNCQRKSGRAKWGKTL